MTDSRREQQPHADTATGYAPDSDRISSAVHLPGGRMRGHDALYVIPEDYIIGKSDLRFHSCEPVLCPAIFS